MLSVLSMPTPTASMPTPTACRGAHLTMCASPSTIVTAPRRLVLLGALAAASAPAHARAAITSSGEGDAEAATEAALISILDHGGAAGTSLSSTDAARVEGLVAQLEKLGGSQRQLAEGIGGFEVPWLGCWDVRYTSGAGAYAVELRDDKRGRLRLVRVRQFVYGPADAKAELSGASIDGSTSLEALYESAAPPSSDDGRGDERLLLVRSGSLSKLPAYSYRLDFAQPAAAYALPAAAGRMLTPLPAPAIGGALFTASSASGATLRRITYLSERLWISRGSDDGSVTLLLRCDGGDGDDGRALAPPRARPDLTAPCSDSADRPICRRQALF